MVCLSDARMCRIAEAEELKLEGLRKEVTGSDRSEESN
jgi:hypothetical protein